MGSLAALWLGQRAPAQLWLLGRSGRTGSSPRELGLAGRGEGQGLGPGLLAALALITLARCDVSAAEEAAHVARQAAQRDPSGSSVLQAHTHPKHKRLVFCQRVTVIAVRAW